MHHVIASTQDPASVSPGHIPACQSGTALTRITLDCLLECQGTMTCLSFTNFSAAHVVWKGRYLHFTIEQWCFWKCPRSHNLQQSVTYLVLLRSKAALRPHSTEWRREGGMCSTFSKKRFKWGLLVNQLCKIQPESQHGVWCLSVPLGPMLLSCGFFRAQHWEETHRSLHSHTGCNYEQCSQHGRAV